MWPNQGEGTAVQCALASVLCLVAKCERWFVPENPLGPPGLILLHLQALSYEFCPDTFCHLEKKIARWLSVVV